MEHLLADEKSLWHLVRILASTKILVQVFGNLSPPTRTEPGKFEKSVDSQMTTMADRQVFQFYQRFLSADG